MINETLARIAKENMSHSDYREGSATEEFNNYATAVKTRIETAKARVSEEGKLRAVCSRQQQRPD